MSQEGQIPSNFAEWVVRSLDGTISPEEFAQLDHEIATNGKARAYYWELITIHVGLVDLVGGLPRADTLVHVDRPHAESAAGVSAGPEDSDQERIREIERRASRLLAEFLAEQQRERFPSPSAAGGWDLWESIERAAHMVQGVVATGARLVRATVVCLLVLAALSLVGLYIYSHRVLGVLVNSANAKWDVPIDSTGELRAGRRTLEEGYAQIRLKRGAEIIVQAPSTFDLRGTNRMFLESGWITAAVPPAAKGFAVRTPASSVVDFGTEFGLMAGDVANAEVHVFEGRIEFERTNTNAGAARQSLARDEAVIVDAAGRTSRVSVQERPRLFSHALPAAGGFGTPGKRLGLADMVGGGNGLDTGVWGQGVDASSGQITSRRTILKKNDKGFVVVPSRLFIDGVFVPDSKDGSTIVTSTGLSYAQCPKTSGTSYEAIVNGASFQVGSSGEILPGCLAGRTYDTRAHPSIGIHPNAGITFDLDAIRRMMPEAGIRRFQARCGVSENVVRFAQRDADPKTIAVTFWVLLDGQPRFSRTLGVVPPQSEPIDVPIDPGHRFLTLATTTPGEYRYCWALFAEPALELKRLKSATAGASAR